MQIQQNDIRLEFLGALGPIQPVTGFAYNFKALLTLQ
jgi:hypothetical protein